MSIMERFNKKKAEPLAAISGAPANAPEETPDPPTYVMRDLAARWGLGLDDTDLIIRFGDGFPASGVNTGSIPLFGESFMRSFYAGTSWGGASRPSSEKRYMQSRIHDWELKLTVRGGSIKDALKTAKARKAECDKP